MQSAYAGICHGNVKDVGKLASVIVSLYREEFMQRESLCVTCEKFDLKNMINEPCVYWSILPAEKAIKKAGVAVIKTLASTETEHYLYKITQCPEYENVQIS